MTIREELRLDDLLRNVRRSPQTYEREIEMKRLELDLEELQAERKLEVIRKRRMLMGFMQKNGRCTAMHPDGTRLERVHNEYHVDNAIQAFWNDWYAVQNLAEWATP